jgi:hypothetical protein
MTVPAEGPDKSPSGEADDGSAGLVLRMWEALGRGDIEPLRDALAPGAQWLPVYEDWGGCDGREEILDWLEYSLSQGLKGRIEETVEVGPHVLVAFRPDGPVNPDRPLDEGIAYMVLTLAGGAVTEMKGCADRASALAYMGAGG